MPQSLSQKLHDPSLLQACPPVPPELFKQRGAGGGEAAAKAAFGGPAGAAWDSPAGLPPGAYKLLGPD